MPRCWGPPGAIEMPVLFASSAYLGTSCISMNGDLPGCSKRWSGTIGSYQYRTSRSPWAGAAAELAGDVADVSPAHHQPRPTPATSTSSATPARTNVCLRFIAAAPRSAGRPVRPRCAPRSEEHTSELQSLISNSYSVFCLKKKIKQPLLYETKHSNTIHLSKHQNQTTILKK